jgi:transcriptional regulator with XRE-family HTH domain
MGSVPAGSKDASAVWLRFSASANLLISVSSSSPEQTFGQFLATARKRAGLSQKDFAGRVLKDDGLPISGQYVNDLERDRRNPPPDYLLKQIASVLGLSYDELTAVAGQFPEDLREKFRTLRPDRRMAAMQAFRTVLAEQEQQAQNQ